MENLNSGSPQGKKYNRSNKYPNNYSNADTASKDKGTKFEKSFKSRKRYENKKFPFNERHWVPDIEIEKDNPDIVRVISYNILADSLISISTQIAESDLEKYPYLLWEKRRATILKELKELDADIVSLQEFEKDEVFLDELGKMGYDSAFKPRTGHHSEGCAIIWKNQKFKVENLYSLEFNMNITAQNISPIYDRDNICLIGVFQYVLDPKMCFIVSNIHVLFNNNRGDVKLGQVYQTLNTLQALKNHYTQFYSETNINIILCGDLNSIPNSGVYKMITEGAVDCTKIDKRRISGQREGSIEFLDPKKLKTSLLKNVTIKFKEDFNKNMIYMNNEQWFNDIICVESRFNPDSQFINLKYKENHVYNTGPILLSPQLKMSSAYAEMLNKTLRFMKECQTDMNNARSISPFDRLTDFTQMDNTEVYGIKMSYTEIDHTLNFVKKLTLEPPFSFYGKGMLALVDYIFFTGNITPIRTLNIPDVNRVAFDIGYLPTELFPSDHISLCVDFQIVKESNAN